MKRRVFLKNTALTTALASFSLGSLSSKGNSRRPNILLIVTDQESWLDAKARDRLQIPNKRWLMEKGVSFENYFCVTAQCTPARSTMQTGLWPHQTNMVSNANKPWSSTYPKETEYLGNQLRKVGYKNGYAGKWHLLANPKKLGVGKIGGTNDKTIALRFSKFLQKIKSKEQPWFFQANFLNPHDIYKFGQIFEGQLPKKRIKADKKERLASYKLKAEKFLIDNPNLKLPSGWDAKIRDLPTPKGDWAHPFDNNGTYNKMDKKEKESYWLKYKALYYILHEEVDQDVGGLLDIVRSSENKLLDNTIIIWTSDHGDLGGNHESLKYKGPLPFDSQLNIPLIISGPGIPQGELRAQLASQIDLASTICDLAGTSAPNEGKSDANSFLPIIQKSSVEGKPAIFNEYYFLNAIQPLRIIRTKRYKYCEYLAEKKHLLFDLKNDPWERENVEGFDAYKKIQSQLQKELHLWQQQTNDPISATSLIHPPWKRKGK